MLKVFNFNFNLFITETSEETVFSKIVCGHGKSWDLVEVYI